MQKALEQDSTVYDYDAVYDEIQNQRLEKTQKILHGTDKKVILASSIFKISLNCPYVRLLTLSPKLLCVANLIVCFRDIWGFRKLFLYWF